jgi:dephospho-CoA kinase
MSISNKPLIIGLAGTLNAGKDILGDALAERDEFLHLSGSDIARQIKKEAFGDTPEALLVRADPYINHLRQKNPGMLIEAAHNTWLARHEEYPHGLVVSGVRAIGEVEYIKNLGGVVVFVDASPRVRYQRSQTRLRDANDRLSFEEFIESEKAEMPTQNSDKTIQDLVSVSNMADIIIDNTDDNIDQFIAKARKSLQKFLD